MPNRIIKESINESRSLSECSFFTQDLYKRLITYADDYGRFNADTQIMLSRLYPRDTDIISHEDIIKALIDLCGAEKVQFYTSQPRKDIYGCFPNWGEHQRIRDSKTKYPAPDDTEVNDWYLRMFVPLSLKIEIIERDNFECQECKKSFKTEGITAKKLIKLYTGVIHIDHIVPVNQGGRATYENLRLLCATCNLSRKKFFTFEEILSFAENCGKSPQKTAKRRLIQSNPIRIQSESESNPNCFEIFWNAYPKKKSKGQAETAFKKIKPDKELLQTILDKVDEAKKSHDWKKENGQYIPYPATWLNAKGWLDEYEPAKSENYYMEMLKNGATNNE